MRKTWLRKHLHPIKSASVMGATLLQKSLLPDELLRKPRSKQKYQSEMSGKKPRTCYSCGLVGHFAICCMNSEARRMAYKNQIGADKASENSIAALTQRK